MENPEQVVLQHDLLSIFSYRSRRKGFQMSAGKVMFVWADLKMKLFLAPSFNSSQDMALCYPVQLTDTQAAFHIAVLFLLNVSSMFYSYCLISI